MQVVSDIIIIISVILTAESKLCFTKLHRFVHSEVEEGEE